MRFARHSVVDQKVVDLIPVVNIVLLLMFFFLLSWSFVLQPGVEVKLPGTSFSDAVQRGRHIMTLRNITGDNPASNKRAENSFPASKESEVTTQPYSKKEIMVFFDEKVVALEELRKCLKEVAHRDHGEWITLNADEAVSHGYVQQVAAWAMEAGFRVTIATQRVSASSKMVGE